MHSSSRAHSVYTYIQCRYVRSNASVRLVRWAYRTHALVVRALEPLRQGEGDPLACVGAPGAEGSVRENLFYGVISDVEYEVIRGEIARGSSRSPDIPALGAPSRHVAVCALLGQEWAAGCLLHKGEDVVGAVGVGVHVTLVDKHFRIDQCGAAAPADDAGLHGGDGHPVRAEGPLHLALEGLGGGSGEEMHVGERAPTAVGR